MTRHPSEPSDRAESRLVAALATVLSAALACSSQPAVTPDAGDRDAGPADTGPLDAGPPADAGIDAGSPDDAGSDAGPPDAGPSDSGPPDTGVSFPYVELRCLAHIHTPWSHDACDGNGIIDGGPNPECLAQWREGACASELDFVALTDHPAYMASHTFEEDLLYDAAAGDELLPGDAGPVANRMACPGGHRVMLTVGFEGTHAMPLGLRRHLVPSSGGEIVDTTPVADAQALVAEIKAAGGVAAIAHSEEAELSAPMIDISGAEAMEWYNPHGNFKTVYGGDTLVAGFVDANGVSALDILKGLEPFMLGSGPHPDLVYLLVLTQWPTAGFDKWREVQKSRAITGILGTDTHQNVHVDPLCERYLPTYVCDAAKLAPASSPAIALSALGGSVILSDGDRLDSFKRTMRWLENRVFATELSPDGVADALRKGRSYGLFSVFGAPAGFGYWGRGAVKALFMGESTTQSARLSVRAPLKPVAMHGVPFTDSDAALAEIRTVLFRTDSLAGTVVVREAAGLGAWFDETVLLNGAYHVEVWLKPKHLARFFDDKTRTLADREYLWVITNPIRIGF